MCAPVEPQIIDYFEWLELLGYGDVANELRERIAEEEEVQQDELSFQEIPEDMLIETDSESDWGDDEIDNLPDMMDLAR